MQKKKISSPEKKNSISFSLSEISVLRFNMTEPGPDIKNNYDPSKLMFAINLDIDNNPEQETVRIALNIGYRYNLDQNQISLLDTLVLTGFHVSGFSSIIDTDKENIYIPTELLASLVSISYSSARGIIFSKTQGSWLNRFFLPLIDPKILIENKINAIGNSQFTE